MQRKNGGKMPPLEPARVAEPSRLRFFATAARRRDAAATNRHPNLRPDLPPSANVPPFPSDPVLMTKSTQCIRIQDVKYFSWSAEKNEQLMHGRGISFEEIVFHIEQGDVLDLLEHPDQTRYPGQRIFVVDVEGYAYLVPFVETETEVFLKTIIPSRKATRDYLGGE